MNITEVVPWVAPQLRQLKLKVLHYPKGFDAAHYHWDLDQGYRLEVLGVGLFWLALLRPEAPEQNFLLRLESLALGQWPDFPSDRLGTHSLCCLISQSGRAPKVPRDWPNPVLWVRQPFVLGGTWAPPPRTPAPLGGSGTTWAGNDFFTPEQILYQWGRVGRRFQRYARLRRWLPW